MTQFSGETHSNLPSFKYWSVIEIFFLHLCELIDCQIEGFEMPPSKKLEK